MLAKCARHDTPMASLRAKTREGCAGQYEGPLSVNVNQGLAQKSRHAIAVEIVHVVLNVAVGVPNRFHEHPSALWAKLKRHETRRSAAKSGAPYRAVMSMVLYVRGRGDALGPACTCTYREYEYQPAPPYLGFGKVWRNL
jgi:hypothetical protein